MRYLLLLLTLIFGSWQIACSETIKIVAFGDSLMAGYQLPASDAYPAQLEKALLEKGYDITITNAGVSGDTSSGGLARLDWSVPSDTDLLLLELGANDMLRGINPHLTAENLAAIVKKAQQKEISVVLFGMLSAPNMGEELAKQFNQIYPDLAAQYQLPFYPFFLDGVTTHLDLQLGDGMHPNKEGVAVIVRKTLPLIEKSLQALGAT